MSVYRRGVVSSSTTLQSQSGFRVHQIILDNNLENLKILESMYPYLAKKIMNRKKLVEIDFLMNALNATDIKDGMKKELKQKLVDNIKKLGGFSPEKYIRPV